MDKLKNAIYQVASRIFSDFSARGAVLRDGVEVDPQLMASHDGGLPMVLWVVSEFYRDYKVVFPDIRYRVQENAYTGYVVDEIVIADSSSVVLYMLSDFLRNEMLAEKVMEIDIAVMLKNFQQWCAQHVMASTPALADDPQMTVVNKPD